MSHATPEENARDFARVLDAVRDCPDRGREVDRPDPACGCGGTVLCLRDTRAVSPPDCVACRCVAIGITEDGDDEDTPPAPAPPAPPRTMAHVKAEWVSTAGYLCRDCATGCQASVCHAGRGGPNGRVTLADCLKCLRGGNEPTPKENRP